MSIDKKTFFSLSIKQFSGLKHEIVQKFDPFQIYKVWSLENVRNIVSNGIRTNVKSLSTLYVF